MLTITKELEGLCKKFSVKSFEVFGSAAVTETFDDAQSDLDFLIEFMSLEPTQHARQTNEGGHRLVPLALFELR